MTYSSSSSCYCSYWLWPLGEEETRRIPHESTHQRGTRIFLRIDFSWYRCYDCHSICLVSKLMVLLIPIVQRTKTKKRQRKMKKQRKELSTTPREAEKEPFDDSWYIWCNNRFSWLLCSEIVLGRYQFTNKHDSFVLLWSLDQSLMGALQRNSFQKPTLISWTVQGQTCQEELGIKQSLLCIFQRLQKGGLALIEYWDVEATGN